MVHSGVKLNRCTRSRRSILGAMSGVGITLAAERNGALLDRRGVDGVGTWERVGALEILMYVAMKASHRGRRLTGCR